MTYQMQALSQGMVNSARAREAAVDHIKMQTATLLHAFGEERVAMAGAQRAELARNRGDRSRAVAEMINSFHVSHGQMAAAMAETLGKLSAFGHRSTFHAPDLTTGVIASHREFHADPTPAAEMAHYTERVHQGGGAAHAHDERKKKRK